VAASFRGSQGILPWLALPGSTIPLIAASIAIAAGCLIARRPNGAALAVTAVPVTAYGGTEQAAPVMPERPSTAATRARRQSRPPYPLGSAANWLPGPRSGVKVQVGSFRGAQNRRNS
jgi:hypothetical protein